jgi:hypothetical protein
MQRILESYAIYSRSIMEKNCPDVIIKYDWNMKHTVFIWTDDIKCRITRLEYKVPRLHNLHAKTL